MIKNGTMPERKKPKKQKQTSSKWTLQDTIHTPQNLLDSLHINQFLQRFVWLYNCCTCVCVTAFILTFKGVSVDEKKKQINCCCICYFFSVFLLVYFKWLLFVFFIWEKTEIACSFFFCSYIFVGRIFVSSHFFYYFQFIFK